jgi:glycogen operon protein
VGVFVNGESIQTTDQYGSRILDDTFYLVFNASELDLEWRIPAVKWGDRWVIELDSAFPHRGNPGMNPRPFRAGETFTCVNRSSLVLRRV